MIRVSILFFMMVLLQACSGQSTLNDDAGNAIASRKAGESDFEFINRAIIERKCLECHSGSKAPHGIDLANYETIMGKPVFPPLIVPFKPSESSFYVSVTQGRMPKNRGRLSKDEIDLIRNWIQSGARKTDDPSPPTQTPAPSPTEPPDSEGDSGTPSDPNEPPDEWNS
jgi:uncharacterized membrane protein